MELVVIYNRPHITSGTSKECSHLASPPPPSRLSSIIDKDAKYIRRDDRYGLSSFSICLIVPDVHTHGGIILIIVCEESIVANK